jgi:hypothetical protein
MDRHDNFRPWWVYEQPRPTRRKAIFTAISGYIASTLIGLGLNAIVAGAVANLVIGGVLLGLSALATGNQQRPTTSTPQAQATINQSAGPRIRGYGRAKLGGTRAFWDSQGGALFQIVMAHHGQIDAVEQFYIGDQAIGRSGTAVVTAPFAGYVNITEHYGDPDQAADGSMMAAWPGIWTADHRLRGIAYWFVRFASPPAEDYQAVFPEGYNTPVRGVCRLSRVFDPRTGLSPWSDNASLCILDYLTHPDGYNRSVEDIDLPSFSAFADLCDESVLRVDGNLEARYRIWGIYALTDDPQDVLAKMRAACDAELYQTAEGKIAIRGGAWDAPTVTVRGADILGHSMEQGNNRFAAFNELKILYTSPDHDYQTVEATPWENLEDQAERGVLASSLNLDMVPSASQARRLAKIHIAKSNPEWKGTIVANLSALDALGERTVRLVLPELDIDDAFFVAGFSIRPDLTGVEISVMSISEDSYTWSRTEEGTSPPIPEDTRPDLTFPVPTGLVLTKATSRITATVNDPSRDDLNLQVQYRAGAGSLWQEMQVNPGALSGITPTLANGTYQVRARWRGPLETAGSWTSPLAEITLP